MCIFIPIMSEMYDKTYRFRKVSCAFVMLTTFAIKHERRQPIGCLLFE